MSVDISNNIYSRLKAIKFIENKKGRELWLFKCNCGKEKIIRKTHVTSGAIKSCGCLNIEKTTKHGHGNKKDKIYRLWEGLKRRTLNNNFKQYSDYGGRGIFLCQEWCGDFINFYNWAINNGYKEGLTIERIDNNKGYNEDNCKFATRKEQQRNRRNNVLITYMGETKCLAEWCEIKNIKFSTLRCRLFKYNWSIERALNESINRV